MNISPAILEIFDSPLLMTAAALILLISAVFFFIILSAILQYHWRHYSYNQRAARLALLIYYAIGIPILVLCIGTGLIYLLSL